MHSNLQTMKGRYLFTLLLLSLVTFTGLSQGKKLEKANKEYDRFAYIDAQKIFEKVAEEGYESAELFRKLGNSYYFNSDYSQAAKWYEILITKYEKEVASEYYFRYAQSLKAIKSYELSDTYMDMFYEMENNDRRAIEYNNAPDYLDRIDFQSGKYKLVNLSSNSNYSDFGPAFYGEKLVFASSRDTGTFSKKVHKWNNKPFLDLYEGKISKENQDVPKVKGMSAVLNTKFHESTPVFTKDLKTVYFTRNNYNKGVYGKAKNGINKLKIYRSKRGEGGLWSNPESLSINNDEYVVAHPALSPDEKKLYFSSNMPGGEGLSDIYVVNIADDGTLGKPKNLGSEINTEGVESFPFIGKNSNDLYFSSNGHIGLGGLDLFVALLDENDNLDGDIINLGEPANSPEDDFAFILDEDSKYGYLSSNRSGGKGDDDIYTVEQIAELERYCASFITGVVNDKVSGELIPEAKVTLFNMDNEPIEVVTSDENAEFNFKAICDQSYFLRAEKENYDTNEKLVKSPPSKEKIKVALLLEKSIRPASVGDDLGKILNLEPIYFNFDKSDIRKDAQVELAKIIAAMQEYPTLKIDVRSHTDSRGDDEYNRQLSDRRVKSTIKYIVNQGNISEERLTGRGYGESQLTNKCDNNTPCSIEDHQLNRRSEFIIISQ